MIIRGNSDGATIELARQEEWSQDPDTTEYYLATIKTGGLNVCKDVYAYDPMNEGLAKFFEGLATDWKGMERGASLV